LNFAGVNQGFDEHVVLQNVSFPRLSAATTCVIMDAAAWENRFRCDEAHHGFLKPLRQF